MKLLLRLSVFAAVLMAFGCASAGPQSNLSSHAIAKSSEGSLPDTGLGAKFSNLTCGSQEHEN